MLPNNNNPNDEGKNTSIFILSAIKKAESISGLPRT